MNDWTQRDYLVFEADGDPVPAYTCMFTPQACLGHVRAQDEVEAAKVVAGVTERVGKYMVLEVTMVDLAAHRSTLGFDLLDDITDTPHRAP